jgi:hypothetical protein
MAALDVPAARSETGQRARLCLIDRRGGSVVPGAGFGRSINPKFFSHFSK